MNVAPNAAAYLDPNIAGVEPGAGGVANPVAVGGAAGGAGGNPGFGAGNLGYGAAVGGGVGVGVGGGVGVGVGLGGGGLPFGYPIGWGGAPNYGVGGPNYGIGGAPNYGAGGPNYGIGGAPNYGVGGPNYGIGIPPGYGAGGPNYGMVYNPQYGYGNPNPGIPGYVYGVVNPNHAFGGGGGAYGGPPPGDVHPLGGRRVGFGHVPGPGTGGGDGFGNLFDQRGQFLPSDGITVEQALTAIGFTEAELARLSVDFADFDSFKGLKESNIDALDVRLSRAPANRRVEMNITRKTLLVGLMHWAQDQFRVGRVPGMARVINLAMLRMANTNADTRATKLKNQATAAAAVDPGMFKEGVDFYRWADRMFRFLGTSLGQSGIPLDYVIQMNDQPQFDLGDDYMLQNSKLAPLHGPIFVADAAAVHDIIHGKIEGNTLTWLKEVKRFHSGRVDMFKLYQVYTNSGNRMARVAQADAIQRTLHYKDEKIYSFSKFLHTAQQMFEIYNESDRFYTDAMKIDFLFDKVRGCSYLANQLEALQINRSEGTLRYEQVTGLFTALISQRQANLRFSSGSGGGNITVHRSSEVSAISKAPVKKIPTSKYKFTKEDVVKTWPKAEWDKLSYDDRKEIFQRRDAYKAANNGRRVAVLSTTDDENGDDDELSPEIVSQAYRTIARLQSLNTQVPGSDSATTVSAITQITSPNGANAGNAFGGRREVAESNTKSRLAPVASGNRRFVAQVQRHDPPMPNTSTTGNIELDSHADTCVLGHNFVVLSFTGRETDVYGYSKELGVVKNVPIVSGATAIQHPVTGETFILVVHEALWYGDRLDHTLLNPNQLRYFGITVNDNPFDAAHPIGIYYDDSMLLPFRLQGTLLFATSRTPTDFELQNCTHVPLTSVAPWCPHTVQLASLQSYSTDDDIPPPYHFCNSDLAINSEYRILGDISTCLVPHWYVETGTDTENSIFHNSIAATRTAAEALDDIPIPKTFTSVKRHSSITPADLSERWLIGAEQAKQTLMNTTQKYVRSAILPLSRRYRTDRYFYRVHLNHDFSADTYVGRFHSGEGNRYAFIIAHPNGFCVAYPQAGKSSSETAKSLQIFTREWGIPRKLTVDGASEYIGRHTEFNRKIHLYDIDLHVAEPHTPKQNPAEGVIREIRKKWYRIKTQKKVHNRLWDYGIVWICEVLQRTVSSSLYAAGRTPLEIITGETPDISEYLDFGFYDWVLFKENAGMGDTALGRFLGVSHKFGNLLSYWILGHTGRVMSRSTVQRLTNLQLNTAEQIQKCKEFDEKIDRILGNKDAHLVVDQVPDEFHIEMSVDEQDVMNTTYSAEWIVHDDEKNKKKFTPDVLDSLLHTQIALPRGPDDELEVGKVTKRIRDTDGDPIGIKHDDPTMDTRLYEVTWTDGTTEELFANTIAENMYDNSEVQGKQHTLFKDIIDHRKTTHAIDDDKSRTVLPNGTSVLSPTTKGWDICVSWVDGSTSWVAMKDVKDSYPIQLAAYARQRQLHREPAFAHWINKVSQTQGRMISKVKSKYWERTHKFGVEIPKSVAAALLVDEKNGNTLWRDAIEKEMVNVLPAFTVYEGDPKTLVGFQFIRCHMIFDVKLGENFRRKARFVAGGHMTDPPATLTYSSVVSRDSVRIALMLASLNQMSILTADIQNAYLHADCREKIYTIGGKEFGSNEGKTLIITKALYGLKSSGAAFRSLLAEQLDLIGYTASRGDPDVWMRPILHLKCKYYEYVLVYVDDLFVVSFNPMQTMTQLQERFTFKEGSIKPPDSFLGAQLQFNENEGRNYWTISAKKYIDAACTTIAARMAERHKTHPYNQRDPKNDYTFPLRSKSHCNTPFPNKYRPELDTSRELTAEETTFYQELIGILRWSIELGRIDILLEVSLLSSHLALPRLGHLQVALRVLNYLYYDMSRSLHMDPRYPDIDANRFSSHADWTDFYRHSEEAIPDDVPEPLGNNVEIHCFVDSDHASDTVSRKSQTGILIFLNRAPLIWYSKKQNSVESSTFGSEFVAMKTAVEQIQALRLKLRWMGVPFDGPASIYCDNLTVVNSTRQPEATLAKKHNGIAYHKCRESVATGMIQVAYESTETNLSDLLTKVMDGGRRNFLIGRILY
jgi:Reverse transcriptase (RNA-dependent DNA polymerase)